MLFTLSYVTRNEYKLIFGFSNTNLDLSKKYSNKELSSVYSSTYFNLIDFNPVCNLITLNQRYILIFLFSVGILFFIKPSPFFQFEILIFSMLTILIIVSSTFEMLSNLEKSILLKMPIKDFNENNQYFIKKGDLIDVKKNSVDFNFSANNYSKYQDGMKFLNLEPLDINDYLKYLPLFTEDEIIAENHNGLVSAYKGEVTEVFEIKILNNNKYDVLNKSFYLFDEENKKQLENLAIFTLYYLTWSFA